jgi:hypothetical protein
MREAAVEKYLRQEVEKKGGMCEKFTSPGSRDVPDRLITWVNGHIDFVEVKAPGAKCRPGQLRDHDERRRRGCSVRVIDNVRAVDAYVASRIEFWSTKLAYVPGRGVDVEGCD